MSRVTTWIDRITGTLTNRITVRVEHRLNLSEMVDGLCSEYVRNALSTDALPEKLSAARILEVVRDEYAYRGTSNMWTWSESTSLDDDECRSWAEGIIIRAFPEMGENRGQ